MDYFDAEFRVAPSLTTAKGVATLEDVRSIHNVTDDSFTGNGLTVAVMDSGVDTSHPVFDDASVTQHDFTGAGDGDAVGHGTGVAGLVTQLAPDAEIVSLRIFGGRGSTGVEPITRAYEWLLENSDRVDVVNMSWGAKRRVPRLDNLHNHLVSQGVRDVVAAGNTGERGGSPATAEKAFSIGALTEDGEVTRFSSFNPYRDNPDVSAVGQNVKLPRAEGTSLGRVIDDQWTKASGTSFAAPLVTAFVAQFLDAKGEQPKQAFQSAARPIPGTPREGTGVTDYEATIPERKEKQPGEGDQPGDGQQPDEGDQQPPEKGITASAEAMVTNAQSVIHLDKDWVAEGNYEVTRSEKDGTVTLEFEPTE